MLEQLSLDQLGGPIAIGAAIVVVLIVLAVIRKLMTLIFVVIALGFGGLAAAKQLGWDVPFVLPGRIVEAARDAAASAAAGYSAGARLDGEAAVQPESLSTRTLSASAVSPEAAAAQAAAADVRRSEIRYNAPGSMQLNMPIDLRLVIDASGTANLEGELEGLPGEIRGGAADLTEQVTASLTGTGFDIRSLKPARQVLADNRASTWQWEVTPREAGLHTLFLEVFAHPGGAEAAASVAEYRDEIDVQVTVLSRALNVVQTTQPVIGFAAAAVSLLFAGLSFVRRRRRR
jgi:hypothetical protein